MKPVFTTDRLNVYQLETDATTRNAARDHYIGIPSDCDWPFPAVVATVWFVPAIGSYYLDMILTNDIVRRDGYATDMVRGIEKHLGTALDMDAATEAGDAFVESLETSEA